MEQSVLCNKDKFVAEDIANVVNYYTHETFPKRDPRWSEIQKKQAAKIEQAPLAKKTWKEQFSAWLDATSDIKKLWDKQWLDNIRLREEYFSKIGAAAEYEWHEHCLLLRNPGGVLARIVLLARAIQALQPKHVLEVGSGDGLNLFYLASMFPDVQFSGVELTKGGVQVSKQFQQQSVLPDYMVTPCPDLIEDKEAFRSIRFSQGSAAQLDFQTDSFDMVITCVALEQMEAIRDKALKEVARVARHGVAMVEPFIDFNKTGLSRDYIVKYNYFQGAIADLPRYGLDPILTCDDVPQKLNLRAGLVLCKKRSVI